MGFIGGFELIILGSIGFFFLGAVITIVVLATRKHNLLILKPKHKSLNI